MREDLHSIFRKAAQVNVRNIRAGLFRLVELDNAVDILPHFPFEALIGRVCQNPAAAGHDEVVIGKQTLHQHILIQNEHGIGFSL